MPTVTNLWARLRELPVNMNAVDQSPAHPEVRAAGLLIYRVLDGSGTYPKRNSEGPSVEFLMMKAAYEPFHWTPPKGHVDDGETALQTAVRETLEESGLSARDYVVDQNFKRQLRYMANGKYKETVYFLARVTDSCPEVTLSEEHTEARWVNSRDAGVLAGWKDMATVLREAGDYVSKQFREAEESRRPE